ncbi:MAG: N-acetylmuramoyl-L-alanine amidase [Lachnospiraceae bacterium]|nr:N-acetylmuramoyl-L-alanine amidase [Lachnospiraceae bacterium]
MATVVLDAGHGGSDFGATYLGRMEKDDNLRLTLAVGRILENAGVNVIYTRTGDVYESPAEKAAIGNAADADYFVSIHRNSSPYDNQYTGIESLVYDPYGAAARMAENINQQLVNVGYVNQGVNERKNLAVLRRTNMPAVLVEAGFINTDRDNMLFDSRFNETAQAIADGILMSLPPS